ncbi:transcriptional regulator GabR [Klebsiella oxytoca]|nr:transcriptional regulator GabR [Klebsiella oxytoca]
MSFIYTGFGPIIEYQFRLSEGSNCVRLSQTWCWSDCRKKPIRSCTSAFTKAIRHAILDGSLPPHSRLPPSRDLAGELGMSRNTILTVYEQLLAEGYVVSRRGSGTFVAKTLPDMFLPASSANESHPAQPPSGTLSRRGQHLLGHISASPRSVGGVLSPAYRTSMHFPTRCSVKFRHASAAVQNPNSSAIAVTAVPPSCSTRWWTI